MYDNMGIEEIIIAQAENRGIKKGERKGEKKAKSSLVKSLLQQTDFSVDRIASIVGVKENLVERLMKSAKCA